MESEKYISFCKIRKFWQTFLLYSSNDLFVRQTETCDSNDMFVRHYGTPEVTIKAIHTVKLGQSMHKRDKFTVAVYQKKRITIASVTLCKIKTNVCIFCSFN